MKSPKTVLIPETDIFMLRTQNKSGGGEGEGEREEEKGGSTSDKKEKL